MRTRSLVLAITMISLLAATATAGTSPPGVNLRWDQCFADAGAQYRNFACDTNSGSERLVGSFELAASPGAPVGGLSVYINLGSSAASLPPWWSLHSAGTCRQGSLSMNTSISPSAVNCVDWASNGLSTGGIGSYDIGNPTPSGAYLKASIAVQSSAVVTLYPGQEYFAFNLLVNHAKTVGTGACAGCLDPVVICLSAIRLSTTVASEDVLLTQGANWSGSPWVSWQMGYPTNITRGCAMSSPVAPCMFPFARFNVVAYDATPARSSTWGEVKGLYR